MSLDTILTTLETLAETISGVDDCLQEPPAETLDTTYPFAIVYAVEGEMVPLSASLDQALHTIHLEIHQSPEVVPESFTAAKVWPQRVFDALAADATLGAINALVVWPIRYVASPIEYGRETHYGVRFILTIKEH